MLHEPMQATSILFSLKVNNLVKYTCFCVLNLDQILYKDIFRVTFMGIRNAKVKDKFAVTEIAENSIPFVRPSVAGTYEYLARCFQRTFFIYEENSKPMGFIVGFPNTSAEGEFWLYQIAIREEYREKGIGSKLFEAFIAQVKNDGYIKIRSHYKFENERSAKAHAKFGFERCGKDDRGWFVELIL
ncbi:MAG: GNAT family N-acetyltransferase [Candidatus Lokiarchaeota archaeon]|nr:GNAT family N-acetyltransferase [Candidatus Lokiarchaeota archaeon]